jgi:hypothetical protein
MAEREHQPEPGPSALMDPDEPEPGWARDIRDRRKARADRLREVFDGFDGTLSTRPRDPA